MTLYLDVELRSDKRPGTEQKTSAGLDTPPRPRPRPSLVRDKAETIDPFSFDGTGTVGRNRKRFRVCVPELPQTLRRVESSYFKVSDEIYKNVIICAFGFALLS